VVGHIAVGHPLAQERPLECDDKEGEQQSKAEQQLKPLLGQPPLEAAESVGEADQQAHGAGDALHDHPVGDHLLAGPPEAGHLEWGGQAAKSECEILINVLCSHSLTKFLEKINIPRER
jgi:hypothetical protein